jgi:hypothetical protein
VCQVHLAVNTDVDVAGAVRLPSRIAWPDSTIRTIALDTPSEHARYRVVVKKFAQTLRGKIGLSHEALQLLIGQRPAAIRSRLRASLFYGEANP